MNIMNKYTNKRKNIGVIAGVFQTLFAALLAFFSIDAVAQVPVGNSMALGNIESEVRNPEPSGTQNFKLTRPTSLSDYELTDFTFELPDLVPMAPDGGCGSDHSIKCQKVTDLDFGRAFS